MKDKDIEALGLYRLEQAGHSVKDAALLLSNGSYNASVNRSYYAMFYGALALLLLKGKGSSKHAGVMSIFDADFILPGVFERKFSQWLHEAFNLRTRADYQDFFDATEKEATLTLDHAKQFVDTVNLHFRKAFASDEDA